MLNGAIPSDPKKLKALQELKIKTKGLGDPAHFPKTQSIGAIDFEMDSDDLNSFALAARGYTYEGMDKRAIAENNAKVGTSSVHSSFLIDVIGCS
jgi:hypothetical protein